MPTIVEIAVATRATMMVTYRDSIMPWLLSMVSYQRREKPVKLVSDLELLKENTTMNTMGR